MNEIVYLYFIYYVFINASFYILEEKGQSALILTDSVYKLI